MKEESPSLYIVLGILVISLTLGMAIGGGLEYNKQLSKCLEEKSLEQYKVAVELCKERVK